MNLKYNYIIIGDKGFSEVSFHDVMSLDNVKYFNSHKIGFDSILSRIILRLTFSKKVNKIIHTPFKRYTFPRLFPAAFDTNPRCYIFLGSQAYIYNTQYIKYLRDTYPNVRLVLYMQDLIKRNRWIDLNHLTNTFDIIISYDKSEAEEYGFNYYPTTYSKIDVTPENNIPKCDVYFCGHVKNRLDRIMHAYHLVKHSGLTCDFYLTGVDDNATSKYDDIHYIKSMTYYENLQHVIQAKAILEIMQDNAIGYTPRLWEAIFYDKCLISDNQSIINTEYDQNGIIIINDKTSDIQLLRNPEYSNDIKDRLSATHFIEFIDKHL